MAAEAGRRGPHDAVQLSEQTQMIEFCTLASQYDALAPTMTALKIPLVAG